MTVVRPALILLVCLALVPGAAGAAAISTLSPVAPPGLKPPYPSGHRRAAPASGHGTPLPHTGTDLPRMLLVAFGLIGCGVAIRTRSRCAPG